MLFYCMEDLKGFEKLIFQLFVLLYFDLFAIQLGFFTWSIAITFYSLIVDFFLQFLYLK